MNSCVLMAKVVSDPQLRSTQDGMNIASMLVEFPSTREGEAPGTLKVDAWGGLAEEMKNSYSEGDNLIIEGRLSMNVVEIDGYKEKKATLVASRIHSVGGAVARKTAPVATSNSSYPSPIEPTEAPNNNNVVDFASTLQSPPTAPTTVSNTTAVSEETTSDGGSEEDWDKIPF